MDLAQPGSLDGEVAARLDDGAAEPQRSFAEDLRDLAGDAQTLFEAGKAYERARLSYALSRGKRVALSFVLALVLVYFAAIAAVVGLLLALAPLLTAWGALAVVTLGLALLAFLFLRSGLKRLRRMRTFLGAGATGAAAGGAPS
jgi:heme/copper-type cytochrome/quinol oxidase subunit 4